MKKLICLIIASLMPLMVNAKGVDKNIISVSDSAEIYVKPDIVEVSLAVETSDKDLKKAQKESDDISSKLIRSLTSELRIEEKNIQTSYINIRPIYNRNNGYNSCSEDNCEKPIISHYENKKGFDIKLKNIDDLQNLLEEAIKAGVTRINDIKFMSSKEESMRKQIQVVATLKAKDQAKMIADALGVSLGAPHKINFSGNVASQHGRVMSLASQPQVTVAPGQILIKATVNIDFEIVP